MADTVAPPRWDLSALYRGLGSRQFAAAEEALSADLGRLATLYDRHSVRGGPPADAGPTDLAAFDEVVDATNALLDRVRTLSAYVSALVSTDAGDDQAATVQSRLQAELASLQTLTTRFEAWVSRFGADALVAASPVAADHAHALRQADLSAAHQMPEGEEALFAELRLTGSSAWNKLHGDLTARLTGDLDGQALPISVIRGLATHPDASVRRRAFDAELAAWESVAVPLAAALNAIKGEANTVNHHRGWPDSLEPVLHANSVERPALDAMQQAAVAAFPQFRRFLLAKARLLGHTGGLPWWDLSAPVPGEPGVSWRDATAAVEQAFGTYSAQLAGLARRALAERWVDAEPRAGKRTGAFCMSVRGDESRVLLNFDGSFDSVQTLAHELGHAYHNANLAGRTAMQRRTPMALAETASIFCETIMVQAGLAAAGDADRLALLNVDLQGACQVVVDIHSRFVFENEVFTRREKGTLPVAELCRLMRSAQLDTYGDGLDPSALHPFMWAVKPHYYSSAYYNWPYCFGLLFGTGLYARYQQDPERFRAGYDDLLSSTGLGSAEHLARRFDIDIRSPGFWEASLAVIADRIDDFERLVDARA
jgi:pepF/M3 family oligoendopeptidase